MDSTDLTTLQVDWRLIGDRARRSRRFTSIAAATALFEGLRQDTAWAAITRDAPSDQPNRDADVVDAYGTLPAHVRLDRGLLCTIFRDQYDAGERSLLREHQTVVLVGDDVPRVHSVGAHLPPVQLLRKDVFGSEHVYLEPLAPVPPRRNGFMFGGSFVWTSDRRWREATGRSAPVGLHDYSEA